MFLIGFVRPNVLVFLMCLTAACADGLGSGVNKTSNRHADGWDRDRALIMNDKYLTAWRPDEGIVSAGPFGRVATVAGPNRQYAPMSQVDIAVNQVTRSIAYNIGDFVASQAVLEGDPGEPGRLVPFGHSQYPGDAPSTFWHDAGYRMVQRDGQETLVQADEVVGLRFGPNDDGGTTLFLCTHGSGAPQSTFPGEQGQPRGSEFSLGMAQSNRLGCTGDIADHVGHWVTAAFSLDTGLNDTKQYLTFRPHERKGEVKLFEVGFSTTLEQQRTRANMIIQTDLMDEQVVKGDLADYEKYVRLVRCSGLMLPTSIEQMPAECADIGLSDTTEIPDPVVGVAPWQGKSLLLFLMSGRGFVLKTGEDGLPPSNSSDGPLLREGPETGRLHLGGADTMPGSPKVWAARQEPGLDSAVAGSALVQP